MPVTFAHVLTLLICLFALAREYPEAMSIIARRSSPCETTGDSAVVGPPGPSSLSSASGSPVRCPSLPSPTLRP